MARRRLPRHLWLSLGAAVLACTVAYAAEHGLESLLESEAHGRSPLTRSIFEISGLYQRIVTVGWRKPEPRFTVVVSINAESDPALARVSLNNVCDQRQYLATLIEAIAKRDPSVIVVDKFFRRGTCLHRPEVTARLTTAIAAVSQRVPVVTGVSAVRNGGVRAEARLPLADEPGVVEGIVNIDPDTRRMALRWCGKVDTKQGTTDPGWCETLALRAARKHEPKLMEKYPHLRGLLAGDHHHRPYVSFLRPEQFCVLTAQAVLGDESPATGDHSGPCPVLPNGRVDVGYLRGKVVILGEESLDSDTHLSVVGPVPGVFMQANFVEALLDDRYFKPIWWLDYLLGLAMFATVKLVAIRLHAPVWKKLGYVVASFAILLGVVLVLVLLGRLYVNPVGIGLLAVVIDGSHIVLEWIFRGGRQ
jgi:CHASE2 domain-containing sensor protein